jgi:hypothetical protein
LALYVDAVERGFGSEVDYGSIVKILSYSDLSEQRRYSPSEVMSVKRNPIKGSPVVDLISTNHVGKTESHFANALPTPHSVDERLFQEAGKLQTGGRVALRLLQFREVSHRCQVHTGNGG